MPHKKRKYHRTKVGYKVKLRCFTEMYTAQNENKSFVKNELLASSKNVYNCTDETKQRINNAMSGIVQINYN